MKNVNSETVQELEVADLNKHKHGDRVLCPCCMYPATLDLDGTKINFDDSCWPLPTSVGQQKTGKQEWDCFLMSYK